MTLLDSARLLDWLYGAETRSRNLVLQAAYAGLTTRINRGDFDHHDTAMELWWH